jgi:hypothetical protein
MWALFQNADLVVKGVMIGLIVASIAVWAIALDKFMLYARSKKAMDRFEQAFWSGQSLDELYRTLSARPTHSMGALFVAAMREWKRSLEGQPRSFAGLQMRIEKVMDVTIQREIERPVHRPVRHGLGHHDELPGHRRPADHLAGGRRSRHRRGPICHGHRPYRCHTGDHFL